MDGVSFTGEWGNSYQGWDDLLRAGQVLLSLGIHYCLTGVLSAFIAAEVLLE